MKSGLNGVGVNSNGLKLWENDAAGLKIIFFSKFGLHFLLFKGTLRGENPSEKDAGRMR